MTVYCRNLVLKLVAISHSYAEVNYYDLHMWSCKLKKWFYLNIVSSFRNNSLNENNFLAGSRLPQTMKKRDIMNLEERTPL